MARLIKFKKFGKLTETGNALPFNPKRVYWINTKGEDRGAHAHKKTKQIIICASGWCSVKVHIGKIRKEFDLVAWKPKGVYVTTEWHTMEECSCDCVLVVIADRLYNDKDYIRNFDKWKRWVNGKR